MEETVSIDLAKYVVSEARLPSHAKRYFSNIIFFFSVRERAVFYKSCNLIGSESGQYSPHPARSQRAVFEKMLRSFLGSLLNHLLISLRK